MPSTTGGVITKLTRHFAHRQWKKGGQRFAFAHPTKNTDYRQSCNIN
ncbi:MAG: hypothetical protein HC877_08025 [Thioploca sp.]|nr:hypothetical protein [Thioploca sp.]